MTINGIESQLLEKLADLKLTYGADVELNDSQNTSATDDLAGVLTDLNPDHQYPPTTKPHA